MKSGDFYKGVLWRWRTLVRQKELLEMGPRISWLKRSRDTELVGSTRSGRIGSLGWRIFQWQV
jgi:hypothetical protein